MKKRLLLFIAIVATLMCLFAISSSAATVDKTEKFKLEFEVGDKAVGDELAMWSEDGKPMVWYLNEENKVVSVTTDKLTFEYKNISIGQQTFGTAGVDEVIIPAVSNVPALYEIRHGDYVLQTAKSNYWTAPHRIVAANLTELKCEYIYNSGNNKLFKAANTTSYVQCLWLPNSLKVIPNDHFHSMKNFVEVRLGESATYIGSNAFRDSSALKTMVVPNTVLAIGGEAFRGTSLTYIVGGAGLKFWGSAKQFNGPTTIYLSDTIKSTLTGFPNSTLIFYTGSSADELTISTDKTVTKLSYDEYLAEVENGKKFLGSWKHWYIVYGYNKCDAFYESNHTNLDENCETTDVCGRSCGYEVKGHTPESVTVVYGKYTENGIKTVVCNEKGCLGNGTFDVAPLFVTKGYSIKADGYGITTDYEMNSEALNAYMTYLEANGKAFEFGIFIGNSETFGETFIKADGTVDNSYAFTQKVKADGFSKIKCTVADFTEEEAALTLVMGLYVIDDGKVSYIQHKGQSEYAGTVKKGETVLDVVTIVKIAELEKVELPFAVPASVPTGNEENN